MPLRIAYLVNQYPMVSHSFIRREIHALERQNFEIDRIALTGWDADVVDGEDIQERNRTRYVLRGGKLPLLVAILHASVTNTRRLLRALGLAVKVGWRAQRPLPYHLMYVAEACKVVSWLKRSGVTHVHAHFGTNSAEVAMLVHVLGGPQYSFTVHGQDELLFGGLDEKVGRAAFVISVSSYGRSQIYRRVDPSLWQKLRVVHCGLESAFHAVAPAPPSLLPRLVCVGRICAEKGQLLLVEAAKRLAQKGVDFELVLAGSGEMRAAVEKTIASHGLSSRIRVTGWITSAQVREELLAARALVLPSFTEGLPVVIMEAMALRRPVLATYVGGIPELIEAGQNGWLFPAGSIAHLVEAMEDCLGKSPDELCEMGELAYARVMRRHSIDIEVGKLAVLIGGACRQLACATEAPTRGQ